jgi:hypothetical protein
VNLDTIQKEIERFSPEEQDQLAACLSVLRLKRNPAHNQQLSDRLADDDPKNWLTVEQLKKKLEAAKKVKILDLIDADIA